MLFPLQVAHRLFPGLVDLAVDPPGARWRESSSVAPLIHTPSRMAPFLSLTSPASMHPDERLSAAARRSGRQRHRCRMPPTTTISSLLMPCARRDLFRITVCSVACSGFAPSTSSCGPPAQLRMSQSGPVCPHQNGMSAISEFIRHIVRIRLALAFSCAA